MFEQAFERTFGQVFAELLQQAPAQMSARSIALENTNQA